jgi:hypothetical protein
MEILGDYPGRMDIQPKREEAMSVKVARTQWFFCKPRDLQKNEPAAAAS